MWNCGDGVGMGTVFTGTGGNKVHFLSPSFCPRSSPSRDRNSSGSKHLSEMFGFFFQRDRAYSLRSSTQHAQCEKIDRASILAFWLLRRSREVASLRWLRSHFAAYVRAFASCVVLVTCVKLYSRASRCMRCVGCRTPPWRSQKRKCRPTSLTTIDNCLPKPKYLYLRKNLMDFVKISTANQIL